MKPLSALKVLVVLATFIAVADTVPPSPSRPENGIRKITVPCSLCAHSSVGRGRLKLHPPDHGQHKGSINAKDHWDVKLTCPFCNGRGQRTVYRLEMANTLDDVPPCRTCGWTGVEKCRKCKAAGLMPCTAKECKSGWIVHKNEIGSGKRNHHYKMSVEPCPTCQGVGRVTCPDCRGLGGTPCRTCNGMGKKVR